MEASVAAGFGVCDVILSGDEGDVILLQQAVRQKINILWEGADDADAGYVIDAFLQSLKGHRDFLALHLAKDTFRILQSGLDALNGVMFLFQGHLLIQYLEFGFDFHGSTSVKGHQCPIGSGVLLSHLDKVLDIDIGKMPDISICIGRFFQFFTHVITSFILVYLPAVAAHGSLPSLPYCVL